MIANQSRAILWAQWRSLRNRFPRASKGGMAATGAVSLLWYGMWATAAAAAAFLLAHPEERPLVGYVLPSGLLLVLLLAGNSGVDGGHRGLARCEEIDRLSHPPVAVILYRSTAAADDGCGNADSADWGHSRHPDEPEIAGMGSGRVSSVYHFQSVPSGGHPGDARPGAGAQTGARGRSLPASIARRCPAIAGLYRSIAQSARAVQRKFARRTLAFCLALDGDRAARAGQRNVRELGRYDRVGGGGLLVWTAAVQTRPFLRCRRSECYRVAAHAHPELDGSSFPVAVADVSRSVRGNRGKGIARVEPLSTIPAGFHYGVFVRLDYLVAAGVRATRLAGCCFVKLSDVCESICLIAVR